MKKYRLDRHSLPYDAFVSDESWLMPVENEGGSMNMMRKLKKFGPTKLCKNELRDSFLGLL